MSREDRRPVSQVPGDSVDTDMLYPFLSYASPPASHHPSTLFPPYNFADRSLSDSFPYNSSIATEPAPYHPDPMHASAMEFPLLASILQEPQLPPVSLPMNFAPFTANQSRHASPPCEWDMIMAFPDRFFANTGYCDFSAVSSVTEEVTISSPSLELSPASAASLVARKKSTKRRRDPPRPRPSGFVLSNPDEMSRHERKRLYLKCLENYICFLHSFFARAGIRSLHFERVSSYRGLTTGSMRTILLYLGAVADTIQGRILHEQNRFIQLQYAFPPPQHYRFHSADLSSDSDTVDTSSSDTCIDQNEVHASKHTAPEEVFREI